MAALARSCVRERADDGGRQRQRIRAGAAQRQYVLISAGGHGPLGTPRGDYYADALASLFDLPTEPTVESE